MEGSWRPVPAYNRAELVPGFELSGPALVFEQHCSTVVNGDWHARVDAQGCLVMTRQLQQEAVS